MTNKSTLNIFVALSGGVDSSVALALLKDAGHDVTGVYFKTYKPETTELKSREYCRQQGLDAQAVCKYLGVPFKVYDLESEYKEKVFDYMINAYKAGITPNPDIMCNKEMKFGIFLERALADGADMIATGHYARLSGGHLLKAVDESKDQSYFLSQVSKEHLSKVTFPLGELHKSKVRELAKGYGLLTAEKKDSQGICFIGQEIDVKEFLRLYIPSEPGEVLNIEGDVIGSHQGTEYSTVGERHGFTIKPEYQTPNMPRLFVISRDIKRNTITVGTREQLDAVVRERAEVRIAKSNWLEGEPETGKEYDCRIRHRGDLYKCTLEPVGSGEWQINFKDTPYAPAAGQFIALYIDDMCLGGGEIQ